MTAKWWAMMVGREGGGEQVVWRAAASLCTSNIPPSAQHRLPLSQAPDPNTPMFCHPSSMMSRRAGVPPDARWRSPCCSPLGFTAARWVGGWVGGQWQCTWEGRGVTGWCVASGLYGGSQECSHLLLTTIQAVPAAKTEDVERSWYLFLPARPRGACMWVGRGSGWACGVRGEEWQDMRPAPIPICDWPTLSGRAATKARRGRQTT